MHTLRQHSQQPHTQSSLFACSLAHSLTHSRTAHTAPHQCTTWQRARTHNISFFNNFECVMNIKMMKSINLYSRTVTMCVFTYIWLIQLGLTLVWAESSATTNFTFGPLFEAIWALTLLPNGHGHSSHTNTPKVKKNVYFWKWQSRSVAFMLCSAIRRWIGTNFVLFIFELL